MAELNMTWEEKLKKTEAIQKERYDHHTPLHTVSLSTTHSPPLTLSLTHSLSPSLPHSLSLSLTLSLTEKRRWLRWVLLSRTMRGGQWVSCSQRRSVTHTPVLSCCTATVTRSCLPLRAASLLAGPVVTLGFWHASVYC